MRQRRVRLRTEKDKLLVNLELLQRSMSAATSERAGPEGHNDPSKNAHLTHIRREVSWLPQEQEHHSSTPNRGNKKPDKSWENQETYRRNVASPAPLYNSLPCLLDPKQDLTKLKEKQKQSMIRVQRSQAGRGELVKQAQ